MNFVDEIAKVADRKPKALAIIDGNRELSYQGLTTAVLDYAGRLQAMGISSGDIVGLHLGDHADHLIIILALGYLGAGSISLNRREKPAQTCVLVKRFKLTQLIYDQQQREFVAIKGITLTEVLATKPYTPVLLTQAEDNCLMVNLSSGTTGEPCGVVVTHRQFADRMARYFNNYGEIDAYRYLSTLPLCFSFGRNWCFYVLLGGASIVIKAELFAPQDYLNAVQRYAINMGALVPTVIRLLLTINSDLPLLPEFKLLVSGGDKIDAAEQQRVRKKLTPNFYTTYSTSGTGPLSCLKPSEMDDHADSVGKPTESLQLEIVDTQETPVATGVQGRIRVRGPGIPVTPTILYGQERDDGDGAIVNGWFYTGELGCIDDQGFLFIKGRISNIIISSGVNIFPGEIEDVLQKYSGIKEAAVVAKPLVGIGDTIAAFVVVTDGVSKQDILRHCRAHLAAHKVPVEIIFLQALPRTPLGKVNKRELTQHFSGTDEKRAF